MAKKTQNVYKHLGYFSGISVISIWLFCHNFWTRNATKSLMPSKDSYYGLNSNKTLSHEIDPIGRLKAEPSPDSRQ